MSAIIARYILKYLNFFRHLPGGRSEPLTNHEEPILRAFTEGKTNQSVAVSLYVGVDMLQQQICAIFSKLFPVYQIATCDDISLSTQYNYPTNRGENK